MTDKRLSGISDIILSDASGEPIFRITPYVDAHFETTESTATHTAHHLPYARRLGTACRSMARWLALQLWCAICFACAIATDQMAGGLSIRSIEGMALLISMLGAMLIPPVALDVIQGRCRK